MFNLFQGCDCPQKTTYAVLVISNIIITTTMALTLQKTLKGAANKLFKMIFIGIVIAVLIYMLITWCCAKNYKLIAWVIALIPLVSAGFFGKKIGNLIKSNTECITKSIMDSMKENKIY
jgi:type IV secretory pathway TrbD component